MRRALIHTLLLTVSFGITPSNARAWTNGLLVQALSCTEEFLHDPGSPFCAQTPLRGGSINENGLRQVLPAVDFTALREAGWHSVRSEPSPSENDVMTVRWICDCVNGVPDDAPFADFDAWESSSHEERLFWDSDEWQDPPCDDRGEESGRDPW